MKTIEHNGHTITIEWHPDTDCEAPWEHEDGHGPVSSWERRDKRPGEWILCTDRSASRFYDFAEAIKIAKRDCWGLSKERIAEWTALNGRKPTRKEIAAESVERDFEYLRRWCNDDWFWCGYTCKIDGQHFDSLWGIDSDSQKEFERDAVAHAKKHIDLEQAESLNAACRDIQTV